MSSAIFREPTPEEADLARRRAELTALRNELATHEFELDSLRAQLHGFEGRYIRQVGVLYIQLDKWEERIAAINALPQVVEPADQLEPLTASSPTFEPATDDPQPALDLKALFREVAKRIHPDFARDARDERHRTRLMAQANNAYLRDDAAILQRMLNGYDPSNHPEGPGGIAAELARVLEQIELVRNDTEIVDAEIATLRQSEMADLQQRTILAATKGRDLLAELAAQVKGSIGIAMRRFELDSARARRKEKAFDPTPLLSAEEPTPRLRFNPRR